MTAPSAKVIADSISPDGVRLTTLEVAMHRFVLAEFNTHRVFSRNSASSRAIPVTRQLEKVRTDPAYPIAWPVEQKGMQGGADIGTTRRMIAKAAWDRAARHAMDAVVDLTRGDQPIHKSVVNRLLEPFMWHTVIVTSTAWENFFALRLDADAQPEIRHAAVEMRKAYDESVPEALEPGQWHTPYVSAQDKHIIQANIGRQMLSYEEVGALTNATVAKISAARCARVSYLTHDGSVDMNADLALYDRLVTDRVGAGLPVHWSPLEHVATPWEDNRQEGRMAFPTIDGGLSGLTTEHLPRVGNLLGWRSLRTEVEASVNARTFS